MHKLQYTSVDKWVEALKTNSLYAILSGFDPDSTPGVGTFYDFFNRLWLAPSLHLMKKKKRKIKKPKKKGKKNQKMAPKNPRIIEKLMRRALKQRKVHIIRRRLMMVYRHYLKQYLWIPLPPKVYLVIRNHSVSLVMEHPSRPVAIHMGNFFVTAANRGTGNVIAFVNFLTLMQTTVGIAP